MRKTYKTLAFFVIIFLTGCGPWGYHKDTVKRVFAGVRSGSFIRPVSSRNIQPFGAKKDGASLRGIVLRCRQGQPLVAAQSGKIIFIGESLAGYGKTVIIRHLEFFSTVYAGNFELFVKQGQWVRQGEAIGKISAPGISLSPELYFEIRKNGLAEDPAHYLAGEITSNSI